MEEYVDIIPIIISNCDLSTARALSHTCKDFNKKIIGEWSNKTLSPFILRSYQYMFALGVDRAFKVLDKCIISASMGSGKTVTAIYFIMNFYRHKNILIAVPPSTLKVWLSELTKVGLLKSKVEESEVLVYHSNRPKHQAHHNLCTNVYDSHRIVLTTDMIVGKIKGTPDLLIRDETHKPVKKSIGSWFGSNSNVKTLGLTAEDVEPSPDHRVLKLIDNNFNDKIPDIKYNFHVVDNDKIKGYAKYGVHVEDVMNNVDEYRVLLIKCIQSRQKVVMFLDKGGIGTEVRQWIDDELDDYKVFELLSTNKTLDTFHSYTKKAILFIGSSNNEGLNVFEENVILFKPDIMAVTRIKQSIGRLRRPGNPYQTINCDIIVGDKIGLLKSFYGVCYSNQSWQLGMQDSPNPDFLLKCCGITGLMGFSNFLEFPQIDMCVIFDHIHTHERFEIVSKWWLENKTENSVLTLDHINALYI
jgi:hypothetical protein